MHALRAFIEGEMDRRGWKAADVARHSGLSKQAISKMLADDREQLTTRIDDTTAAGLARAFSTSTTTVLSKVAEAMGLPVGETVTIYAAGRVSDDELLRVLAARLAKVGEGRGEQPAPKSQRVTVERSSARSGPQRTATAQPPGEHTG